MTFSTLITSAGLSQRMGAPKALLKWGTTTVLERIVEQALGAGSERPVLVLSPADLPPAQGAFPLRPAMVPVGIRNQVTLVEGQPGGHLIDSIRRGLASIPAPHHLLLWPVDAPFADATVVKALLRALASHGAPAPNIAQIQHQDKGGHPVLLGSQVWPELLAPTADLGAKAVIRGDPERIRILPHHDSRLVAPVNTPSQAQALGLELPA